jgi:hypothetical protein
MADDRRAVSLVIFGRWKLYEGCDDRERRGEPRGMDGGNRASDAVAFDGDHELCR